MELKQQYLQQLIQNYVLHLTLSTQDSAKPFEQLKLDFKKRINWNIIQRKIQAKDLFVGFVIFYYFIVNFVICFFFFQGINVLLTLLFENNAHSTIL